MPNRLFFCIVLSLLLCSLSHARWASFDDAALDQMYQKTIHVAKDGTVTTKTKIKATILKESGRYPWFRTLVYNSDSESVEVTKAGTIYQGQDFPVDLNKIEDKPLASTPKAFDQHNQQLIVFPHAEIGATLYLEYTFKLHKPAFKDFYSSKFFLTFGYLRQCDISIESEIPLFTHINDPEHLLKTSGATQGTTNKLTVSLKQPIFKNTTDESGMTLNPVKAPWFQVSSVKSWEKLNQMFFSSFEKIREQEPPPLLSDIVKGSPPLSKTNIYDSINFITSQLSEKMHYMGDWQTQEGRFIPHNLSFIDKERYGDCKDFAVATAAMLKALGVEAHVALVSRSNSHYANPHELPSTSTFNHAIVAATFQGETIWIDPTNFSSITPYVFEDIADRIALVLKKNTSTLSHIPPPKFENFHEVFKVTAQPLDKGLLGFEATAYFEKAAAIPLIGIHLRASEKSINHYILQYYADLSKTLSWSVDLEPQKSRIIQDISFKVQYQQRSTAYQTTLGSAIPVHHHTALDSLRTYPDQIGDLNFMTVGTTQYQQIFNIPGIQGHSRNLCNIKTSWLDASRNVTITKQQTVVDDRITVKKRRILNEEIKSEEFNHLKLQLEQCFLNGFALVQTTDKIEDCHQA